MFSFLWFNSSIAEDFLLVCNGAITNITLTDLNEIESTNSLFEEWKISVTNNKIITAELVNTEHWNSRSIYFLDNQLKFNKYDENKNVINQLIITLNTKQGEEYNFSDRLLLKRYNHNFILSSGKFKFTQYFENVYSKMRVKGKGECTGHNEITNILN